MAAYSRNLHHGRHGQVALLLLITLLAVIHGSAASGAASRSLLQGRGSCSKSKFCPKHQCCSRYNYCGVGAEYCGTGCKNGPCTGTTTPQPPTPGTQTGPGWPSFFTKAIFQKWFPKRRRDFYTYEAFVKAAQAFPAFGTIGSTNDQKREIAAFFGNIQQESGGLKFIKEKDGASKDYCAEKNTQYPCLAGSHAYFGRGPLQLSWNYNYGECGKDLGMGQKLLRNPDEVVKNGATAFKAALWFWMKRGCHGAILAPRRSFAKTIKIINSRECGHGYDKRVENRVTAYKYFCKTLGVNPGPNLRC